MSYLIRYLGPTIGIVALLVTIWIFSYIEDWSRDLSTNVADTRPDAKDERLRPWTTATTPDDLEAMLKRVGQVMPLWSYSESITEADSTRKVKLVRTTKLMRFKDDIEVSFTRAGDQTVVNVHSQSRLGKGDLGQNPRNVREILQYLKDQVGA